MALALALVVAPAIPAAGQSQILEIDRAEVVRGELAVTVRNSSPWTVVAWGVEGVAHFTDGTTRAVRGWTDGYFAAFRGDLLTPRLEPTQRYTITMPLPRSRTQADLVNVTASPTVAILANNVAVGDEADISLLFKARALDQRTWQLLDGILAESRRAAASATDVLELVGRRWNELDEPDVRKGPTYDEISRYLSTGTLRKRAASKEDFLRQLGEETTGRRSLAEAHASRR